MLSCDLLLAETSIQSFTLPLGQSLPSSLVSSDTSSFRSSQSYIQAIIDLKNLFYSRLRNVFYHNDHLYGLTAEGRRNYRACQAAHEHTGRTFPWTNPLLHQAHQKGLALMPQTELEAHRFLRNGGRPVWGMFLMQGVRNKELGHNSL